MSKNIENNEQYENIGGKGEVEENNETEVGKKTMTEEEFSEEYEKLPAWQHVILVLLFLFGLAAIIVGIDFVIDFITELIKKIF